MATQHTTQHTHAASRNQTDIHKSATHAFLFFQWQFQRNRILPRGSEFSAGVLRTASVVAAASLAPAAAAVAAVAIL